MQIKPRDVLFVGIVVVVVAGLYFLSTRGRVPALASNPPEHLTAKSREDCLKCHVPEKMNEMETVRKHPLKWRDAKINCLQCHKAPAPQNAQAPQVSNDLKASISPLSAPHPKAPISNLKSSGVWQKQQ
ncbi:MAG: hypothetical protein JST84_26330 [Acidobacteria bacterium]|nr:hypothetical protein [Acidobacteriota bacterium]